MLTLGTAGHIDHGKSTLVKALTGIDPDRLPEEKQREMTIDLGFASMTLADGQVVSIIDVPGHEKFITNMLAGVGGIDIAMLVIAADDGVMPQTREHLAIIDMLDIPRGLVVVTKRDRVDADWLGLVVEEISATVRGTLFDDAPLIAVSATTGDGLDALRQVIAGLSQATRSKPDVGQPRLPIDRVFTRNGLGTVVTGTLIGGSLQVGERVEVLPQGVESRVRSIQIHNRAAECAQPGGRTALSLVGVERSGIRRGSVVAYPGQFVATRAMDVNLRVVAHAAQPVRSGMRLRVFTGTAETSATVTVLDGAEIEPGARGWVRLRLSEPIVAVRQDRFIVRIPSPSTTLGGGEILDPAPRTQRRQRASTVRRLAALQHGSTEQVLLHCLPSDRPIERSVAIHAAGLVERHGEQALAQLIASGAATLVGTHVISENALLALTARLARALEDYHQRFPLRRGIPKHELRQVLRLDPRVLQDLLPIWIERGVLKDQDGVLSALDFDVQVDARVARRLNEALARVRQTRYAPPSEDELGLSHEELSMLIRDGTLTRVSDSITFETAAYAEMVNGIVDFIQAHGKISIGEFRDAFSTTRKYTMALFDHLDKQQVTRRVGDDRVLGPRWRQSQ